MNFTGENCTEKLYRNITLGAKEKKNLIKVGITTRGIVYALFNLHAPLATREHFCRRVQT